MTIKITKEFSWDMAHRLDGHNGLCNNVHGHTYKLLVTIARSNGGLILFDKSNEGMVTDFKILKKIVNNVIVEPFDHAFVYNKDDKDSEAIAKVLQGQIKQKIFAFPFRTTAENMAKYIYDELNKHFAIGEHNLVCKKIILYETPTSYAEYEE